MTSILYFRSYPYNNIRITQFFSIKAECFKYIKRLKHLSSIIIYQKVNYDNCSMFPANFVVVEEPVISCHVNNDAPVLFDSNMPSL